jgi:hypothetical protein
MRGRLWTDDAEAHATKVEGHGVRRKKACETRPSTRSPHRGNPHTAKSSLDAIGQPFCTPAHTCALLVSVLAAVPPIAPLVQEHMPPGAHSQSTPYAWPSLHVSEIPKLHPRFSGGPTVDAPIVHAIAGAAPWSPPASSPPEPPAMSSMPVRLPHAARKGAANAMSHRDVPTHRVCPRRRPRATSRALRRSRTPPCSSRSLQPLRQARPRPRRSRPCRAESTRPPQHARHRA